MKHGGIVEVPHSNPGKLYYQLVLTVLMLNINPYNTAKFEDILMCTSFKAVVAEVNVLLQVKKPLYFVSI